MHRPSTNHLIKQLTKPTCRVDDDGDGINVIGVIHDAADEVHYGQIREPEPIRTALVLARAIAHVGGFMAAAIVVVLDCSVSVAKDLGGHVRDDVSVVHHAVQSGASE